VNDFADEFYINEQFQTFFAGSANSMVIKANAPHFTILAVSDSFLASTHRKREELIGNSLFEVYPGSNQDAAEMMSSYEMFEKAISTKKRVDYPTFRYEILNPASGQMEVQYWSNYNEPILDENGQVAYLLNTTTNITKLFSETADKELAQSRLKASEENIRNTVRQAPVGMCILKGDPLYVEEVNDVFLKIVGKQRDEFFSAPYWEVNSEVRSLYEPITAEVLRTGTAYHANEHETLLIRNGIPETVYVDFVYEPMKDADGETYALMIVAIDVTDKIIARKELQSAYEQIRLSRDAAQLGTFDMDVINGTMEWDERCRHLFGIAHEEPVSFQDDFVQGVHPEDRKHVLSQIDNLFNRNIEDGIYDVEYRTIDAEDGKVRWIRAKGKVFFNEKGKASRFIGSVIEITDRKEDEQRKSDFIGMVSHELKTPLTSLSAIIQLSSRKLKMTEDPFLAGAMDKASQQIKRMSSMINGFLNLSRLESSKMLLDKTSFDIDGLLREVIDEYEVSTSTHRIELKECEQVMVFADRDKVSSVVSNLISNAVKYSPKGDSIQVNCHVINKHVQVSVADKGMGIKPQDIEHVFDRYYRIESKHTEHIAGFGIGLYLSAEIVRQHKGKIWVESESGIGSTFFFTLPLTPVTDT
jgi:two-component system sensor histidine kinase VicK